MSKLQLASHPLSISVRQNLQSTLDSISEEFLKKVTKTGEIRYKSEIAQTEFDIYQIDALRHIYALNESVNRLNTIQSFLNNPKFYEKLEIMRTDWIEYHFSYFLITIVSLTDIALILVNAIFRLGNLEKDCRFKLITRDEKVKKTATKYALQELENQVKPYRPFRNFHVHRGQIPNVSKITNSDMLDLLQLFDLATHNSDPIIDDEHFSLVLEAEIAKLCKSMTAQTKEISQTIWNLFDSLLPVYNLMSEQLKK